MTETHLAGDETAGLGAADLGWLRDLATELRQNAEIIAPELTGLSHAIHEFPELRFTEHQAARRLREFLAAQGFDVTQGVAGMPTAFLAERAFSAGGPVIGVFCEYDALPEIGHGCGHNIIAAAGAGAGILAAGWLAARGALAGKIVVIGSPAEEGGGGKIKLMDAGVLAGIDAAVMVHPGAVDAVERGSSGRLSLEANFTGRAAHAAGAPWRGRNALDGATLMLVALGLLRQQLREDSRVHAIVDEGGDAVNVIPERARLKVFVRSPDLDYLRQRLESAVHDCAAGAALATGTTAEVREIAPAYEPVRSNPVLGALAEQAFAALGRPAARQAPGAGSTDMGNVSRRIPAIHSYVGIGAGLVGHTREFAAAAGSPAGDRAAIDAAALLGTLAAGLITHPELVAEAKHAS